MDAFTNLEKKVERLIAAYQALLARVADLEAENGTLRAAPPDDGGQSRRIHELESERAALRERLAGLAERLDEIEL